MGLDVECMEGWLMKDKKLNSYRLGITGTQTKRWFRVQYIDGGKFECTKGNSSKSKNLVLCYYKHKSEKEPHGWMFLRDVTNVREVTPTCFVIEHPARSYVLRAIHAGDSRRWISGLQRLIQQALDDEADDQKKTDSYNSLDTGGRPTDDDKEKKTAEEERLYKYESVYSHLPEGGCQDQEPRASYTRQLEDSTAVNNDDDDVDLHRLDSELDGILEGRPKPDVNTGIANDRNPSLYQSSPADQRLRSLERGRGDRPLHREARPADLGDQWNCDSRDTRRESRSQELGDYLHESFRNHGHGPYEDVDLARQEPPREYRQDQFGQEFQFLSPKTSEKFPTAAPRYHQQPRYTDRDDRKAGSSPEEGGRHRGISDQRTRWSSHNLPLTGKLSSRESKLDCDGESRPTRDRLCGLVEETKESILGDEVITRKSSVRHVETVQQRAAREQAEARIARREEANQRAAKFLDEAAEKIRHDLGRQLSMPMDDDTPEFDDEIDLAREEETARRAAIPLRRMDYHTSLKKSQGAQDSPKKVTPAAQATVTKSSNGARCGEAENRQPDCVHSGSASCSSSVTDHTTQKKIRAAKIARRGAGGDELDIDFGPKHNKGARRKSALARRLEQGGRRPRCNVRQHKMQQELEDSSGDDLETAVADERARLARSRAIEEVRRESARQAQETAIRFAKGESAMNSKKMANSNLLSTTHGAKAPQKSLSIFPHAAQADRDFVTANWESEEEMATAKWKPKYSTQVTGGIKPDDDFLEDWDL